MRYFTLDIVTPERIAFSEEVESVTVPAPEGIIGILKDHQPLFTSLVEGEVVIKVKDRKEDMYLAIGGGFLQVSKEKATLLVTSAYNADEINEKEVLEAKKRAEELLKQKPEGEALVDAQALFKRSTIALKVLKRKKTRVI